MAAIRVNPDSFPASEDEILSILGACFPNSHPGLRLCRGDDCAIIHPRSMCVSSDLFLEDVHFRRAYFTAEEIGYKALAVNLSDLAACGAKPLCFTLSLGLPCDIDTHWLKEFFSGMSMLAKAYNMALAGGDLAVSEKLHISITVFGESNGGCEFLLRGGSIPGDSVFIVGQIGLARVGLAELETNGRDAVAAWPEACEAHLRPRPQIEAGLMLARAGTNARPPALMDVSDGLIRDLPRLLGKNGELGSNFGKIGAELFLNPSSLDPEILKYAAIAKKDPVMEALMGGEDYCLLGTCAPDMESALKAAIPGFLVLGRVTNNDAIFCNNQEIGDLEGFDHFYRHGKDDD